jgi:hypothetical protein
MSVIQKQNSTDSGDILADQISAQNAEAILAGKKVIKRARRFLYLISAFWALIFISLIIITLQDGADAITLVSAGAPGLMLSAIFFGIGAWTKLKPYSALMTAIVLISIFLLLVLVINAIEEGIRGVAYSIPVGIILVFMITFFSRRLDKAKFLQQAQDEKS